ncbi:serine hydrolase domain-containing protein [Paenarthrobacter sp. RAF54_2]|uniref:serine hydrolase domain-containing protein n=1 Tax=Paenarthrobacter sp. RAF54_2 TaxID=3233061 RepID=UPI003F99ADF6
MIKDLSGETPPKTGTGRAVRATPFQVTRDRRTAQSAPTKELDGELLAFVRQEMAELSVPGVAIALAHDGAVASAGLGITNALAPLPVEVDTLFQIGSITKPMVGTAIMSLVEQGKIELDAPVQRYLPGFTVADSHVAATVTVRHLMTHSVGWAGADRFDDHGGGEDALEKMVAGMAGLEQIHPLGKMFSYNNTGFYVLGRILEVIERLPFEVVMRRRIFEPLGLDSATFFAHEVITSKYSVGHAPVGRGMRITRPWAMPRSTNAAGGVICTVQDLMTFLLFHLGQVEPKSHVLSRQSRALMAAPALDDEEFRLGSPWIGLTWRLGQTGLTPIVGHGGGAHGQPSFSRMLPSEGFAMAILTNATTGAELAERTWRWVVERYLGMHADSVRSVSALTAADISERAGAFDGDCERHSVTLTPEGLHLNTRIKRDWLSGMEPSFSEVASNGGLLRPISDDVMKTQDGERVEFLRDASGTVKWLRVGTRVAPRSD